MRLGHHSHRLHDRINRSNMNAVRIHVHRTINRNSIQIVKRNSLRIRQTSTRPTLRFLTPKSPINRYSRRRQHRQSRNSNATRIRARHERVRNHVDGIALSPKRHFSVTNSQDRRNRIQQSPSDLQITRNLAPHTGSLHIQLQRKSRCPRNSQHRNDKAGPAQS